MRSELIDMIREDCQAVVGSRVGQLEALRGGCLLVTGGTGFVGTWLAELIAYLNDRHGFGTHLMLLSSRAHNFRAKAPHLAVRDDVALLERDVRGLFEIPAEVEWIIHAAGSPDHRLHTSDPVRTIAVIVQGTEAVLSSATRLPRLRKVLNVSSGLVYGPQPWDLPAMSEEFRGAVDSSAVGSAYAEAKRLAETLCAAYRNQHRLPIVNARPFAFIGPYQLLDRPWAVNNFLRDGLLGGPIRIQGDGETVRSYLYPSDMAWWLLRLLLDGKTGASYNVGSPEAVTLLSLAQRISELLPARPDVLTRQAREGAPRSTFVPDVTLSRQELGLSASVDLDTALRRTLAWNRATIGRGRS
jgi:nucleoside-diphosphate-sugar epimerase